MPNLDEVEKELVDDGFIGYCDNCGELFREGDAYCPKCGKPL